MCQGLILIDLDDSVIECLSCYFRGGNSAIFLTGLSLSVVPGLIIGPLIISQLTSLSEDCSPGTWLGRVTSLPV